MLLAKSVFAKLLSRMNSDNTRCDIYLILPSNISAVLQQYFCRMTEISNNAEFETAKCAVSSDFKPRVWIDI